MANLCRYSGHSVYLRMYKKELVTTESDIRLFPYWRCHWTSCAVVRVLALVHFTVFLGKRWPSRACEHASADGRNRLFWWMGRYHACFTRHTVLARAGTAEECRVYIAHFVCEHKRAWPLDYAGEQSYYR